MQKHIIYSRDTRDYRAELDGNLIGYFPNCQSAHVALDEAAFDQLHRGPCLPFEELVPAALASAGLVALTGVEPIAFSGWFCSECHCSTSFLPTPGGESAVCCNNPRCGKTVMLSCAAEALITQEQLIAQRALTNDPPLGPLPEPGPDGPDVPETPEWAHWMERFSDRPRAFTRISIEVEAKLIRCRNCDGPHFVQSCPELRQALLAKQNERDVAFGRALCQIFWKDHAGFVALLSTLETARLTRYADCYIAFIHENRPDTDLRVGQLLHTWLQLIVDASDDGPPPAAPAARLRLAA